LPELIVRIRFQCEQLERSLPEIEQLFRTLWIRASHGRVVLILYHAAPIGRRIADIKFLLDMSASAMSMLTVNSCFSLSKRSSQLAETW
jgi:hypothetical protein